MRFNRLHGAILAILLLMVGSFVLVNLAPIAHAQTSTTGAISGDIKDPSGAVVPNAKVTITNEANNSSQVVTSNSLGRYTASHLNPGVYKVSATAQNLQSNTTEIEVLIGTTVTADIGVSPKGDKTTVEVTASTLPLVDTQNVALATTFNEKQIEQLPTPGGDVTTVAFTAPGVVVNVGGGYGNFSANGIPGISNLFVLNGFDNQDPFLNLNNSGSSNLTLGQGELAEATVIENGYNSNYGRAAGVTINYTTKAGGNAFHGEADYNYNGTILNANSWFGNYYGGARPHAVSNEWAGNVGGPIIKDKVFFFADYEGLNYVLPGASGLVNFPSTAMQSLAPVQYEYQGVDTGDLNQLFKVYQGASAYGSAVAVPTGGNTNGGCGDLTGYYDNVNEAYIGNYPTGITSGSVEPCMTQAFESVNNVNKEWLNTDRIDWQISDKHRIFGRFKVDHGTQPTGTSFISPLFSTVSSQPEYEGQFNDSYQFSPTLSNVFIMAANWYTAYFGPSNISASQAAYPWNYYPSTGGDGSGTSAAPGMASVGVPYYFPQGRNVTQYQLQDDFNWTKGKHNFKFGFNFRRDLMSDYDAQVLQDFPIAENFDMFTWINGFIDPNYYGGVTGVYVQNYPTSPTAHLALYNLGVYAQDEFQASNKLKLTLGLRVDRTGNPLCQGGCFSEYASGTFPSSSASVDQPYINTSGGSINAKVYNAFKSQDLVNVQPRFGFNYSINDKTEIRGGVGMFADLYPAVFLDGLIQNFPNVNSITTYTGDWDSPSVDSYSATSIANSANSTLATGFANGSSLANINNVLASNGIPFTPPGIGAYFPGQFHSPIYVEYNLQLQREINKSMAILFNYTGNYGYHEVLQNPWVNAGTGYWSAFGYGDNNWDDVLVDIPGVPVTPPDPSFSKITSYTNDGHSNYNGGWVALKYNAHGLSGQMTYTYSHSLDTISNAGVGLTIGSGLVGQVTPSLANYNLNYSNADYDIRNNFVADLVYEEPYKTSNPFTNEILGGWTIGVKTYARGGTPFSVTNYDMANTYGYEAMGGTYMGQAQIPVNQIVNTTGKNPHGAVATPGMSCADFYGFDMGNGGYCEAAANGTYQATLGNVRRNAFYGPGYHNTDISLTKSLFKHEKMDFKIGANAYNVFNNVNFSNPGSSLGLGNFGLITSTVAPPTSPYGSFQGNGVTQRLLQIHGKFTF